MKNKVSKITMLTALFVAGMVNAQEFYTCVPKKSWWENIVKNNCKNSNHSKWNLIKDVNFSNVINQITEVKFNISPGKYKLVINHTIKMTHFFRDSLEKEFDIVSDDIFGIYYKRTKFSNSDNYIAEIKIGTEKSSVNKSLLKGYLDIYIPDVQIYKYE